MCPEQMTGTLASETARALAMSAARGRRPIQIWRHIGGHAGNGQGRYVVGRGTYVTRIGNRKPPKRGIWELVDTIQAPPPGRS